MELHGDRRFADDPAIVCGLARFHGLPVMVIGHQKGRDTKQRSYRNFGMPKPEGYRKALRAMKLAEKFRRPIFTLIDTPGAYPGIDAEERGQAEAIAYQSPGNGQIQSASDRYRYRRRRIRRSTRDWRRRSGVDAGECDLFSYFPRRVCRDPLEGCRPGRAGRRGSASHRADLFEEKIVDQIISEPPGGAHTDYDQAARLS